MFALGESCVRSTAPDHPQLTVRRASGSPRVRKFIKVTGIAPPVDLRAFNDDINTLETAVKERVFYVKNKTTGEFQQPPKPEDNRFRDALAVSRTMLCKLLPLCTAPLSYSCFVATFRGRKKAVYQRAYESLLGRSVTRKDAEIKVFVKYEKVNFSKKTTPVPRVISPRDPRYNVEIGRYLRPIEERIFKSINELYGGTTIFKGINSLESGRAMWANWSTFRDPVAVGLDASRFDQHVSPQALAWEHAIYRECYKFDRHKNRLGELLSWQLDNNCRGYCPDGKLKYTVPGCRMSGDMNTSLGNCLLMCMMMHGFLNFTGITARLANNGDDCVVFMEREDLHLFRSLVVDWFHALGFTMVVEEPVDVFEKLEFCQTQPVFVGPEVDDYLMVRNPFMALAKDCVAVKNFDNPKMFLGWIKAVGQGGMSLSGGVPILQAFYDMYDRSGVTWSKVHDHQSYGRLQAERGMNRRFMAVSDESRASFYWAFGITPDEQREIEYFYHNNDVSFRPQLEMTYQPALPY